MRLIILTVLFVSSLTFAMENPTQNMSVIKTFDDAQQFANRFVVYKPRLALGESVAMPKENAQFNYGYIHPRVEYFSDGATKPQGPPSLRLFVLSHLWDSVRTRVLSDKTLAQEALLLRTANATECERITAILKSKDYFLQYTPSSAEGYCTFSRYDLTSTADGFKSMGDILKDQIALLP